MLRFALSCRIENNRIEVGGDVLQRNGEVGSFDNWDSLIGDLYESVLNPGNLVPALARIDRWLGSSCCHLLAWDDATNSAKLNVLTNWVLSPDILERYERHYCAIDPRRKFSLTQPVGKTVACHDHFDDRFVDRSEFYQDLLIPGGARYILFVNLFRDDASSAYIVFNHLKEQGHFSAQQRKAVERLVPHVQRTIRLAMQNERFRGGLIAGATGLDALEQAVFTLDANEYIIFLNSAARELLAAGKWVKTYANRLATRSHAEAGKLDVAITRARLTRLPETFALYGSDNVDGQPETTHLVTILPIPRDSVLTPAMPGSLTEASLDMLRHRSEATFLSHAEAELVVLVSPQRRKSSISAAALKALFGLTPAEARLAHQLGKGLTVEGCAEAAALSVATVRTQLRSILAKTGENRLQDLVKMLSSLPGNHV